MCCSLLITKKQIVHDTKARAICRPPTCIDLWLSNKWFIGTFKNAFQQNEVTQNTPSSNLNREMVNHNCENAGSNDGADSYTGHRLICSGVAVRGLYVQWMCVFYYRCVRGLWYRFPIVLLMFSRRFPICYVILFFASASSCLHVLEGQQCANSTIWIHTKLHRSQNGFCFPALVRAIIYPPHC